MTQPGIETWSPTPLANTLTIMAIAQIINLVGKVFANGPRDQGSIPGQIIPKTLKNGP